MNDPEAFFDARQELQRACWNRDREKDALQRQVDHLNGEIETLTLPTISEKANEWQQSLVELKDKKIIQKFDTRQTVDAGPRITFSSNFETVRNAKEKLIESIKTLRGMRLSPLGEILKFVEKIENELGAIDFSILIKEAGEVTEARYEELSADAEVKIMQSGSHILINDKIVPTYSTKRRFEKVG